MKTKIKTVYYCDYCKKHSFRTLVEHEKHCTANPDRECRLCQNPSVLPIIEKIKGKMSYEGGEYYRNSNLIITRGRTKNIQQPSLEDIKNELDELCPNCILTIIRCTGLNKYPYNIEFDYKDELEKWWKEFNDGRCEEY